MQAYVCQSAVLYPTSAPTSQPTSAPTSRMELIAGTSQTGNNGDNGPATSAQIAGYTCWVDTNGNIYIPEDGNFRIRKISPTGIITPFGGSGSQGTSGTSGPIGSTSFDWPFAIVGDAAGTLFYLSDQLFIWKLIVSSGIVSVYAHTPGQAVGFTGDNGPATSARLSGPRGLWLTTSGVLYFADRDNHRVRKITSSAIITTVAGTGSNSFSGDNGAATSANLNNPFAVYMDTTGKLFIADYGNHRIRVVATNNTITTFAGTGTTTPGGENIAATSCDMNPIDVKGDSLGNIYIADYTNYLIRIVGTNGIIFNLFGTAGASGFSPGIAVHTSRFNAPWSVWVDSLANVYFRDVNSIHRSLDLTPTVAPTAVPTFQPTVAPTRIPTAIPTAVPTVQPTRIPTAIPTAVPTVQPTRIPTVDPTAVPTVQPTRIPTVDPTAVPTVQPTRIPTVDPTAVPTVQPTRIPTVDPTAVPTVQPTRIPTVDPTAVPTVQPTRIPTVDPTAVPTVQPSRIPTAVPTAVPTTVPTTVPTYLPSSQPSSKPTRQPTVLPSCQPTGRPTSHPTVQPSGTPSCQPSRQPSRQPTCRPTSQPSRKPSNQPSTRPSNQPSAQPTIQPSVQPIRQPTSIPSSHPSTQPSRQPTGRPSLQPTTKPSSQPSLRPSSQPTRQPTATPSKQPTCTPSGQPTSQPSSQPSRQPSSQPTTQPSNRPSNQPSVRPTSQPSRQPSANPTWQPTCAPSDQPSSRPTSQPSRRPSNQPTVRPSTHPSKQPSSTPTRQPSTKPSGQPTCVPSNQPSCQPTSQPSRQPTARPSCQPSKQPSSRPTQQPTAKPSKQPTCAPSSQPSHHPTSQPSKRPSNHPSTQPTSGPSSQPTSKPMSLPSSQPTLVPTVQPTARPSVQPTCLPTVLPSQQPTFRPSEQPSSRPSEQPTGVPTAQPSGKPSSQPSFQPSNMPSSQPTSKPSCSPSQQPSSQPTQRPSTQPSAQPVTSRTTQPSALLTKKPSSQPSQPPASRPTQQPSTKPSKQPTCVPSGQPSCQPSSHPSRQPSNRPSTQPTAQPSSHPTLQPISRPSSPPTRFPSAQPTSQPSEQPSKQPTTRPSGQPTHAPVCTPTVRPTGFPSSFPTSQPTTLPSSSPSSSPSGIPTSFPSVPPTIVPSVRPSSSPTGTPSCRPSFQPVSRPSGQPSRQPTSRPSRQPIAHPTAQPSRQPTSRPSNQPTAAALPWISNNFRGTLFLLGTGSTSSTPDTSNIYLHNFLANQRSFIIFGQEKNKIQSNLQIGSRASHGFYAEISSSSSSGTGMSRDSASRSITVVGDLNDDGFDDLVVGFPYESTCFVYFGSSEKRLFQELIVSFVIYGLGDDEFGWSVSRAGNMNSDNYQEMVICAKTPGICYVFFGKPEFITDIYIRNMTATDGFRIIGSTSDTVNFGMAIDYVGDFNNDGWNDLMISAMSFTTQGIVYIVLGRSVEKLNEDIIIENALPSSVFSITAPPFSFAGLSLAGIGDLNNDGFADIAIGSIPYQGGYSTQRTFIIYGRRTATERGNTLDINEMIVGKDGFTVIGGGFLVAGIGDVNQDGIADCMFSSYYNWQSKGNAYLMNYPRNVTSSPTFLPSSLPSSHPSTSPSSVPSEAATTYTPSNHPSVITSPPVELVLRANESASPSYANTVKPTKATNNPTVKKTPIPSLRSSTNIPSLRPTVVPSVKPTRRPIVDTVLPSQKPTVLPKTRKPSFLPTVTPTSNQTFSVDGSSFDFIVYDKPGEYTDTVNKNLVFVISAPGAYHIVLRSPELTSTNKDGENDVKVLSLVPVYNQIIVDGFDALTDIIDLRKYPTIGSFEDLSYSTNPLIIKLPASLQPVFLLSSSSSSGSSVTSQDKFSSTSESSASYDDRKIQEQTITFTSFKNMKLFSERNFRFVPRTVPHRIGRVGSSEKAFQRLLVFGILILSVSVIFFFKCLREDILSEEKEELKEHEYKLQFTQIEIDSENQLEVVIVQNAEEFPAGIDICSEDNESVSSSDDSLESQSVSHVDSENYQKKDENSSDHENDSLGSWNISNPEQEKEAEEDDNEILGSNHSSLSLESWDLSEDDNEKKKEEDEVENIVKLTPTSEQQNYGISLPISISPSAITSTRNAEMANDQMNITTDNNNLSLLQYENEAIKPDEQTSHVHWSRSSNSSKSSSAVSSLKSQVSADNLLESLFND
jgi:hypothetical protein